MVVGLAPLHPITKAGEHTPEEVSAFPMPDIMTSTFKGQVQRIDFCTACLSKTLNLPVTDIDGKVLASPGQARAFMKSWRAPESAHAKKVREDASPATL